MAAKLAGEFERRRRVGDHPGVEQIEPGVEVIRALEEEGSFFREEEGEARVDG